MLRKKISYLIILMSDLQYDASFEQKTERELIIYCGVKCHLCEDDVIQKTKTSITTCNKCKNLLIPEKIKYHLTSTDNDVSLTCELVKVESIRRNSNEK